MYLVFNHVQLFVTPWAVVCQAPLSMGILQTRKLEWVAMPSSRGSSQTRDWTLVSCIAGGFCFYHLSHQGIQFSSVTQSCLTLCNLMDCSPPGTSVHRDCPDKKTGVSCHALLQGILPCPPPGDLAMPSSRGSSQPRDWTQVSCIAGGFFTVLATREAKEYWSG